VAPSVFEELGAHVVSCGVDPDGENINRDCGTMHPELLRDLVLEHKASIGIAFDGDADRAVFIDERGEIVDGDAVMCILASHLKEKGLLKGDTVVTTIASNMGMELCLKDHGIKVLRTNVGDRYVLETLLREGLNFGGEKSGHVVFLDHNTTGDGIVTALQMLGVLIETGNTLGDLKTCFRELPQVEKNVQVKQKKPIEDCPPLAAVIEKVEKELGGGGRVVVRYSGTEMLLRVMVEGEMRDVVEACAGEIAGTAQKYLSEE
jgi:phosphoglucosamine mutase